MPLSLTWRNQTELTVEADPLTPEAGLERRRLRVGNGSAEVGELFRVEGDGSDGALVLEGDLRQVHGIGRGMSGGTITVRGDAGDHLGAGMTGGRIEVEGSVGAWAGAEMSGGVLQIRGDAGDGLGAAYPGSRLGMREGVILVSGGAGDDVGLAMRRGLIAVAGAAGEGAGRDLIAGSVFVFGAVGRRPGAGMKRGTVALGGLPDPADPPVLPTFAPAGRDRPPFLALYLRRLRQWGFPVPEPAFAASWERYNGDLVGRGQGEILVAV